MTTTLPNPKIHGSYYPNGNWKSQNLCDKGSRSGYQVTWHKNGNMKSSGDFENNRPTGITNFPIHRPDARPILDV